jgi:Histidine kinase-, DNA gyrase B-, and HSP90-like ATPase
MAAKKTNVIDQTAEKRAFRMHPRLLWDVITRQAGTLSKAGLELVMNSIDAGATHCDVTLTPTRVMVVDDGKGFVGREEIEKFFETFGQPHEEGDATYGRFRMGRGQAFAFGRSKFFSNDHLMDVDIKPQENAVASDGLNYQLTTLNKPVKGCRVEIDLYDKLLPSQVDAMVRELSSYVKFAQIPVSINGTVVNTLPKDKKWTMETDDAYFDLKDTGTLQLYSLGVLVRDYPASRFGAGGTVVSKKTMDLKFRT